MAHSNYQFIYFFSIHNHLKNLINVHIFSRICLFDYYILIVEIFKTCFWILNSHLEIPERTHKFKLLFHIDILTFKNQKKIDLVQ